MSVLWETDLPGLVERYLRVSKRTPLLAYPRHDAGFEYSENSHLSPVYRYFCEVRVTGYLGISGAEQEIEQYLLSGGDDRCHADSPVQEQSSSHVLLKVIAKVEAISIM